MKTEMNPEFAFAMEMVEETDRNLFLTGRAGTGKTTFLKELVRRGAKRMVVLAPTGIAAINAGGSTLHSFFQLPFGLYLPGYSRKNKFRIGKEKINLMRSIDLMVIDEVSMLRADILDEVSGILKRYRNDHRPFGGVQLLMIGDLQQLAPIVKDEEWEQMKDYYASPYFFESEALKSVGFSCVELQKIYRQNDISFIGLLEKIRTRNIDQNVLDLLHSRYVPGFTPPEKDGYITLTTHNYQSDRINEDSLAALPEKEQVYEAQINGNFPESSFPTAAALRFKPGAQVMFVKNDSSPDHRYYNGK
ncbi:MAG: AAA family ATPase, partial [Bacteroidales bacterium]|nr:AAA family ATPase [Bacteroidales bacterium]